MAALIRLSHAVLTRHPIPPARVLAHSDVAPARKLDPGELFDWAALARAGIGLWSEAGGDGENWDADAFEVGMRRFGYADASPAAVRAFQRHIRPRAVTGLADAETAARLMDLIAQAER
jgi:N-acetylmuramoyl-L-alanine amidase